jgi:hypothetical protein
MRVQPELKKDIQHIQNIAIGSKKDISKVIQDFKKTSVLLLQNSGKKINLIGPIKVRATGPKTFSIVDKFDPIEIEMRTVLTENKNRKREHHTSLAKQLTTFYSATTKRPSLRFDAEVLKEPSLKFHLIPKNREKLFPRYSTTAQPKNAITSPAPNLRNPGKPSKSLQPNTNSVSKQEITNVDISNPFKTEVLPASIGDSFRQRKPKDGSTFRFENEPIHSLRVRFEEAS